MQLIRDTVDACLRKTPGIRGVGWLGEGDLEQVQRLEAGAGGENAGFRQVLARAFVCAALSDADFRHDSAPCVQWVVDGVVVGEEVTDPKRRADLLASPAVGQLGPSFFLYYDRMRTARGKAPTFVYRPLPFAEVTACRGVRGVVSASPGAAVDRYLKMRFGWPRQDSRFGTILIGFSGAVI